MGLAISGPASFRSLGGMSSRPVALPGLSFDSSRCTKLVETFCKTKSLGTIGVRILGIVEFDMKFPQSFLAIVVKNSLNLVAVKPSQFEAPVFSFFFFLGKISLRVFHISLEFCSSDNCVV